MLPHRISALASLCALLLAACNRQPAAQPAYAVTLIPATAAHIADHIDIATVPLPLGSDTPAPTSTLAPTGTPSLVNTPAPTDSAPPGVTPLPTAARPPATSVPRPATSTSTPTPVAAPCPPAPGGPQLLRAGVCARKIAEVGGGYVRLRRDPRDGALFALSPGAQVMRIAPDGALSQAYSYAQIGGGGFTLGMAFGPDGTLYIVGNNSQAKRAQCTLRALGPDSAAGWRTVFTTDWYALSNTAFDHHCNGILVSPDNQTIYVNSGSRTDHGEVEDNGGAFPGLREEPLTSAILRVPVAASGLTLPNDDAALKAGGWLFADGMRNAFDMAVGPQGQIYAIDNGPDADYPEELNALRAGAHYGFPWRFGTQDNPQRTPGYNPANDPHLHQDFVAVRAGAYHNDPDFPAPPAPFVDPLTNSGPAANENRADDGSTARGALNTFTPHRSPLGLNFDLAGELAGDLKYAGFVLSYGAAGGTLADRGQDLLALRLNGNTLSAAQLATGFDHPIDAVLDGHVLYVLENGGNGAVWAVTLP